MEESIKLYPVGSPATIVAFAGSELFGCCDPKNITDIELGPSPTATPKCITGLPMRWDVTL